MRVGLHVSISGSLAAAVDNAVERECSAFQIFTRSPRMWTAKEIPKKDSQEFKEKLASSKIDRFATVAHMPYLPNFASPNSATHTKSVSVLIKEVERCAQLGIPYLVAHLGSHLGEGEEKGIKQLVNAFKKFDDTVGFENLKILHLNDSKGELGSNLDRHEHIGLGKIGEKGMASVVKLANKKNIPIILETPIDNTRDDFGNIKKVKEIA